MDEYGGFTPEGLSSGEREAREQVSPRILVPLDGTERALSALPIAKALADLEGGTLHVVHVCEERLLPPRELAGRLGLVPEDLAGTVIDEMAGDPGHSILSLAAGLARARIVIAAHSEHENKRLGHVTRAVLAHTRCPVFLVRPERGLDPWALQRLVLPHDGSARTAAALQPAVDLAERAGASLFVLHVATWAGEPRPDALTVPSYVDQPQYEWPEWAREFLEQMEMAWRLPRELQPRLFLSKGNPGQEIVRFAEQRRIDL